MHEAIVGYGPRGSRLSGSGRPQLVVSSCRCSCLFLHPLVPAPSSPWDSSSWRPLAPSPGSLLASPGAPWAPTWATLGGSWPAPRPSMVPWSGPFLGSLGRLLAAKTDFSRILAKKHRFSEIVVGPPGSPLGDSWAARSPQVHRAQGTRICARWRPSGAATSS